MEASGPAWKSPGTASTLDGQQSTGMAPRAKIGAPGATRWLALLHLDRDLVVQTSGIGADPVAAGNQGEPRSRHRAAVHPPANPDSRSAGGAEPDRGIRRGDAGDEAEDVALGRRGDPESGRGGIRGRARRAPLPRPRGEPRLTRPVGVLRREGDAAGGVVPVAVA